MRLDEQVKSLESLSRDLASAACVKDKVRIANRIYETLAECDGIVEKFIVASMSGKESVNGHSKPHGDRRNATPPREPAKHNQFFEMSLAEISRTLLGDGGTLHGQEIENLAKAGGFESKTEKFQSYLAVALKRAGGFENIGKNRWRINGNIPPESRLRTQNP